MGQTPQTKANSISLQVPLAALSIALAVAGIVLVRSQAQVRPIDPREQHVVPPPPPPGTRISFSGPGLRGTVSLSQTAVARGQTTPVYAEIQLNAEGIGRAVPVAVAAVIDVSGSMEGDKIIEARRALQTLIDRMNDNDMLSVVAYSDRARYVQPLARLGDIRHIVRAQVAELRANGGTNIHQGLAMGANALVYAPPGFVQKVMLLSDGRDTYDAVAHHSARAVLSLAPRTSISTLGIGRDFDESFMTTVAEVGQGNYAFLGNTSAMMAFMENELRQTQTTTADQVAVTLNLPPNWSVRRVYGAEYQAHGGSTVRLAVGSISSERPRNLVVHLDVPAGHLGDLGAMRAEIQYVETAGQAQRTLVAEGLRLIGVESEHIAIASRDMETFARSRALALADDQTRAIDAYRQGRTEEARALSAQVASEAEELRQAVPSAAPQLAPVEQSATGAASVYQHAPDSAEGVSGSRRARARSTASARGRDQQDAYYE